MYLSWVSQACKPSLKLTSCPCLQGDRPQQKSNLAQEVMLKGIAACPCMPAPVKDINRRRLLLPIVCFVTTGVSYFALAFGGMKRDVDGVARDERNQQIAELNSVCHVSRSGLTTLLK